LARLKYVARHYIRPEALIAANARIVDYLALELATRWGGGDIRSSASPRSCSSGAA
jgi:TnpA family transposase